MPESPDLNLDEGELVESGELHTKCASPRRLSQELEGLLGDAKFRVEVRIRPPTPEFMLTLVQMRHNVYHIKSSRKFSLVRGNPKQSHPADHECHGSVKF